MLLISSVRDLGVHIDSDVIMQRQVVATVRSCFSALRQLCSVRRCLSADALLTLVWALVVSKVDYCCSVLAGVSNHLLDRLRSVLNAAARLVYLARRSRNITPTPPRSSLVASVRAHRLRFCVLTYRCQSQRTAPSYLDESTGLFKGHLRTAQAGWYW